MPSKISPCIGALLASSLASTTSVNGSLVGKSQRHTCPSPTSQSPCVAPPPPRSHHKFDRFPFYWEFKTLFLLFLALPQTQVTPLITWPCGHYKRQMPIETVL